MRFDIDGWDPGYGAAVDILELPDSASRIDATLEVSAAAWSPIAPAAAAAVPGTVLFVDGVRRVDARAWIDDVDAADGERRRAVAGLCASYAAGVVCACGAGAHVIAAEVRRGLFSDASTATDIETGSGTYGFHRTVLDTSQPAAASLSNALQRALADLEVMVAVAARQPGTAHHVGGDDLLIVDGPLRGKAHLDRTLGYVKTHGVRYLPPQLNDVVADLETGSRTPVFAVSSSWERYSWYLRLPCSPGSPWAGVVRLEAAIELPLPEVITLANVTQNLLGRFASVEYKDARAPQNLIPIAGLENDLRHRLGLAPVVYRSLRAAARSPKSAPTSHHDERKV